jgi:hypothetical protein
VRGSDVSAERAIFDPGPDLRGLVAEASQALARLDAGRLEELAASCQALNREWPGRYAQDRAQAEKQARAALGEMATLARVLDATRSNLRVMRRLQALRDGDIQYGAGEATAYGPGDADGYDQ